MDRPHPHTPLVEWVVAGISTVLLLLMLGFVLREALTGPAGPPALRVRADSVMETPGGYLLLFTVWNDGGETAASATVLGTRMRGDSVLEVSESTLDFVPTDGSRVGGLLFAADPRMDSVALRVAGFEIP